MLLLSEVAPAGGEPITGQDALKWGLVSRVYPTSEAMLEDTMNMAKKIASKS